MGRRGGHAAARPPRRARRLSAARPMPDSRPVGRPHRRHAARGRAGVGGGRGAPPRARPAARADRPRPACGRPHRPPTTPPTTPTPPPPHHARPPRRLVRVLAVIRAAVVCEDAARPPRERGHRGRQRGQGQGQGQGGAHLWVGWGGWGGRMGAGRERRRRARAARLPRAAALSRPPRAPEAHAWPIHLHRPGGRDCRGGDRGPPRRPKAGGGPPARRRRRRPPPRPRARAVGRGHPRHTHLGARGVGRATEQRAAGVSARGEPKVVSVGPAVRPSARRLRAVSRARAGAPDPGPGGPGPRDAPSCLPPFPPATRGRRPRARGRPGRRPPRSPAPTVARLCAPPPGERRQSG